MSVGNSGTNAGARGLPGEAAERPRRARDRVSKESALRVVALLAVASLCGTGVATATTTTLTCTGSTTTASDGITADSTLIQNAINAATAGDTIVINAGTCEISKPLTIGKALTLQGAQAGIPPGASGWASGATKLHGFYNAQFGVSTFTVVISASNVTVSGFEFGDTGYNPIDLEGTISNVTISNNYIHSSQLWGGIILGNGAGTFTNVTIDGNTIVATGTKNASPAAGLIRYGSKVSPNLRVVNNIFQQAPVGGFVLFGWAVFDGLVFENNEVKSGLVNVGAANKANFAGNTFDGPAADTTVYGHGLYVNANSADGVTISGNSFLNGGYLEFGSSSRNVSVRNNAFGAGSEVSLDPATTVPTVTPGADPATIQFALNRFSPPAGSKDCTADTNVVIYGPGAGALRAEKNWWGQSSGPADAFRGFDATGTSPWIAAYNDDASKSGKPGFWPIDVVEGFPLSQPTATEPAGAGVPVEQAFFSAGTEAGAVTFPEITTAGSTTVTQYTASYPQPASGFSLGDPPVYYTIATTAAYSGKVEVCLYYAGSYTPKPQMLHYNSTSGAWENITKSVDPVTMLVCGETATLSPVVLGQGFNSAPVADPKTESTTEDTATPLTITLSGSDADNDAGAADLTFAVVSGPAHGTLANWGAVQCTGEYPRNCTQTVDYTPASNYNGSDSFTYKVNDGSLDSSDATVGITVTAANDAPVAKDRTVSTPENVPVTISLEASDVDSASLAFSVVSGPTHGTLGAIGTPTCSGTGPYVCTAAVTYTPDPDFYGSDSFTYKASDGTADSPTNATVAITVDIVYDTTLAYVGPMLDADGNTSTTFAAKLASATGPTVCQGGKEVTFWLRDYDGQPGWTQVAKGTTNAAGDVSATWTHLATLEGAWDVKAVFAGDPSCGASVDESYMLTVALPGDSTYGGGWYKPTSAPVTKANFGYTAQSKTDKRTGAVTISGSLLWHHEKNNRVKSTAVNSIQSIACPAATSTNAYAKCARVGGVGQLTTWVSDSSYPDGGYWANPQTVSFVATVYDGAVTTTCVKKSCSTKTYPDAFGMDVTITPALRGETAPITLSGGSLKVN